MHVSADPGSEGEPGEWLGEDISDHRGKILIGGLPDRPLLVGARSFEIWAPLRMVRPGTMDLVIRAGPNYYETPHRITGVVVYGNGHSVEGARVVASPQGFRAPEREDRTSATGTFCLLGLQPGHWLVRAVGPSGKKGESPRVIDGACDVRIVVK